MRCGRRTEPEVPRMHEAAGVERISFYRDRASRFSSFAKSGIRSEVLEDIKDSIIP